MRRRRGLDSVWSCFVVTLMINGMSLERAVTQSRTDSRSSIGTAGTKDGELICAIALARKEMLSSVSNLRSLFKAPNPASKPAILVAGLGWSDSSDMFRGVESRGGMNCVVMA